MISLFIHIYITGKDDIIVVLHHVTANFYLRTAALVHQKMTQKRRKKLFPPQINLFGPSVGINSRLNEER